jgi:hypothetical protein
MWYEKLFWKSHNGESPQQKRPYNKQSSYVKFYDNVGP